MRKITITLTSAELEELGYALNRNRIMLNDFARNAVEPEYWQARATANDSLIRKAYNARQRIIRESDDETEGA